MQSAKMDATIAYKRQAEWDGVRLVHFRFNPGELPEHSQPDHLIAMSMGDGCGGEIRTASGMRARAPQNGSICVIPSGLPYSARLTEQAENLAMFVSPEHLDRIAYESQLPTRAPIVERCEPGDPVINRVGLELLAEMDGQGIGGRLYAESLVNILSIHLLRHYTATDGTVVFKNTGGLTGKKLRRVTDFIADHYERDLSLAELAGVAGVSTFHFAREFKRATGTTPHQHLINYRVERAKAMLADGELPLVEVGFRSGFSHQSHFTRLFRRLTGTTPHSYRLMLQN
jgi:AraC family transcriptional regulator